MPKEACICDGFEALSCQVAGRDCVMEHMDRNPKYSLALEYLRGKLAVGGKLNLSEPHHADAMREVLAMADKYWDLLR